MNQKPNNKTKTFIFNVLYFVVTCSSKGKNSTSIIQGGTKLLVIFLFPRGDQAKKWNSIFLQGGVKEFFDFFNIWNTS